MVHCTNRLLTYPGGRKRCRAARRRYPPMRLLCWIVPFVAMIFSGGVFEGELEAGTAFSRPKGKILADAGKPLVRSTAPGSRISSADARKAEQSMRQLEESLFRKEKKLIREREAILSDIEALNGFGGGRTLQGSRGRAYVRRVEALNERKRLYSEEKEQLEKEYQLYEASLQKIQQGIAHGRGAASASNPEEMERLKTEIEDWRRRLVDEYQALKEERARISIAGSPAAEAASVAQQMAEWNARLDDHAQRRRYFNDVIDAFNTTTGQNLATLAPL
jgi:hypothetical protein